MADLLARMLHINTTVIVLPASLEVSRSACMRDVLHAAGCIDATRMAPSVQRAAPCMQCMLYVLSCGIVSLGRQASGLAYLLKCCDVCYHGEE